MLSTVPGISLTDNGGWTGDTTLIRGFSSTLPYRDGMRAVDSGYKQSEDPEAYRGTTAWLDDADAAVYMPYNTKTRERAVWLTRSRLVSEDVKSQPVAVRLDEESLFLEAARPSPQIQLVTWLTERPHASLVEAVEFLKQAAPGKCRATYYNWAKQAGVTAK